MFQQEESVSFTKNIQEKKKRQRRSRRRKKAVLDGKSEITEKDENKGVGTTSQTEEGPFVQEQLLQAEEGLQKEENVEKSQKDTNMVEARTQTKPKGKDKFTQTVVVFQKNQETQTDFLDQKQNDLGHEKIQSDRAGPAETEPKLQHNSTTQGLNGSSTTESMAKNENVQSAGTSAETKTSQREKDVELKSYAKAVSGGEKQHSKIADEQQRSSR